MLLDLLHEDINQISTKPYIEYPVYTSFDKSQSGEMWNFHLCRNKSQIVDWFYGQSVTFVKCTECGEVRNCVFLDNSNVFAMSRSVSSLFRFLPR